MRTRFIECVTLAFLILQLAACGGGGGSSGGGGSQPPVTPQPKSISGIALLGPVSGANVQIVGTGGLLATGTTRSDGTFGPISYSGSYSGPLRVRIIGNSSSNWTCDFYLGCPNNNTIVPLGDSVPFDGEIQAVLSSAVNGQTVSVSMLSNIAAARMDSLGGLTAANVIAASADIAGAIRSVFQDTFAEMGVTLPDNITSLQLFDLNDPPAAGSSNDALSAFLALLNSGLMGLASPLETTGDFIAGFSGLFADSPVLPVASQDFTSPSHETLLNVFLLQMFGIDYDNPDLAETLDQFFEPSSLFDVIIVTLDAYLELPRLSFAEPSVQFYVDDAALVAPITYDLQLTTTDGSPLASGDYDIEVYPINNSNWLSATPVEINNFQYVRLEVDRSVVESMANGTYTVNIIVDSTTGELCGDSIEVELDLAIVEYSVIGGDDQTLWERSSVTLNAASATPSEVTAVNWSQTAGPAVQITDGDTFQPTIYVPGVDDDVTVTMRIDVDYSGGQSRFDTVDLFVRAYVDIADITFDDTALQQCVADTAAINGWVDAGEVTSLSCSGVANMNNLDLFVNLQALTLTNNFLNTNDDLLSLLAFEHLQYLDISGNPELSCHEIDLLAERWIEGAELIVDDTCRGGFALDLGAPGFDAAYDQARDSAYISVPDRNEIAVVSLSGSRIVDRLSLPGSPRGIDISIDGTRLYVALYNSNSIAVVDIDQRTVDTIDLDDTPGHATTWDVIEGAPDRLFVSANPGSSGFAYITQILLDQGNIMSRVADGQIIRAAPVFARAPDQNFVYVGSGFSPNSLYKLSLMDPDAPIVLEDDHGSVSGTYNLALNSTGTRIALASGQVLRTASFIEEGSVSAGRSVAGTTYNSLFVAGPDDLVEEFDFDTLAQIDSIDTGCSFGETSRILSYDNDASFLLLQDSTACLSGLVSRSTPPDPLAALRLPDLALERCVIDTATMMGYTQPEEFTDLDCSYSPQTILNIDGLERFTNLQTLDLSNSGVIDLSPLQGITALQSVTASNAKIVDIDALLSMQNLSFADLSGNPGVACTDLDALAAGGVAVQADVCNETVRVELSGIGHDMEYDAAGNRVFVSIPSVNRISEIDLDTGSVLQNLVLPGSPRGIDLSSDNRTVYAALYGSGDLAVVDSTNGNVETVNISTELDDDRTWDVAEVSPDRVVVSTNPGSNGFGYIVEVRRDLSNAAARVASNRIIRAAPVFAVSADAKSVYVGEGFSPNSLYKLDASQAGMPIVLEDDHGSVSGTDSLALSPDGFRIYLKSGQAIDTDTMTQIGQFPPGRSVVNTDGSKLIVGDVNSDSARVYDTASTGLVETRQWGCNLLNLTRIYEFGNGVLVLGDDLVCFSRTVSY